MVAAGADVVVEDVEAVVEEGVTNNDLEYNRPHNYYYDKTLPPYSFPKTLYNILLYRIAHSRMLLDKAIYSIEIEKLSCCCAALLLYSLLLE